MSFFSNFTGRTPISKIPPFAKPSSPIPLYSKHLPLKTIRSTRPRLSLRTMPSVKMRYHLSCNEAASMMLHFLRLAQLALVISIIVLTGNFISKLASNSFPTPLGLAFTLVFACLVAAHVVISYIRRWCQPTSSRFISIGLELACSSSFLIVSILLYQPVYLKCSAFPKQGNTANFIHSLFDAKYPTSNNYDWLVDPSEKACEDIKLNLALSVGTCVLFAVSAIYTGLSAERKPSGETMEPKPSGEMMEPKPSGETMEHV